MTNNEQTVLGGELKGIRATAVCVLVLIGIGLRVSFLMFAWENPARLRDDHAFHYERLSTNILDHKTFSLQKSPPFRPTANRTPLYPAFISVARLLFPLDVPRATAVLQVLLAAGTMLVLYLVAKEVEGVRLGILAVGILALEPLSIVFSSLFVPESLFAFLLTFSTWLLLVISGRKQNSVIIFTAVCLGITLGLLMLCKPSGVPLVVVLLLGWIGFVVFNLKLSLWKGLTIACLAGMVTLIVLAPWLARNEQAFGRPVLTTWKGGHVFTFYAVHLAMDKEGALEGLSSEEAYSALVKRHALTEVLKAFNEGRATELELSDALEEVAIEYVKRYPLRALGIHIRGCLFNFLPGSNYLQKLRGKFRSGTGLMGRLNRGDMTAVVDYFRMIDEAWIDLSFSFIVLVEYGLIATGIVMALLGGCSRQRYVFLLWPILAYLLLPGAAGEPRMRVPVMPLMSVFVAKGLLSVRPISLLLRNDTVVTDPE